MMASAIRKILFEELFSLARRLLDRLEKYLHQDLDAVIEGQEQLLDDLEEGQSIRSLAQLKGASPGGQAIALQVPDPAAANRTRERIETLKPKVEDRKAFRTRLWIGLLLLSLLVALAAVVTYVSPSVSPSVDSDDLRFWTGLGLLVFVLAIALTLPDPAPRLPGIILRYMLAAAIGMIASAIPGTLELELPNWGEATGGLAGFALALMYTPRPPPL